MGPAGPLGPAGPSWPLSPNWWPCRARWAGRTSGPSRARGPFDRAVEVERCERLVLDVEPGQRAIRDVARRNGPVLDLLAGDEHRGTRRPAQGDRSARQAIVMAGEGRNLRMWRIGSPCSLVGIDRSNAAVVGVTLRACTARVGETLREPCRRLLLSAGCGSTFGADGRAYSALWAARGRARWAAGRVAVAGPSGAFGVGAVGFES